MVLPATRNLVIEGVSVLDPALAFVRQSSLLDIQQPAGSGYSNDRLPSRDSNGLHASYNVARRIKAKLVSYGMLLDTPEVYWFKDYNIYNRMPHTGGRRCRCTCQAVFCLDLGLPIGNPIDG